MIQLKAKSNLFFEDQCWNEFEKLVFLFPTNLPIFDTIADKLAIKKGQKINEIDKNCFTMAMLKYFILIYKSIN